MGFRAGPPTAAETENLPRVRRTVAQTIFNPVLNLLDAPANATRSLAAAIRTGESRYISNAVRSMVPFAGSVEVTPREATGSDSYINNLAFLLAADPLMFVTGVGTLTKPGRLLKGMREAALLRRTYAGRGLVQQAAGEEDKFRTLMKAFRKLPKTEVVYGSKVKERNIVSLSPFIVGKGKGYGDVSNVTWLLSKSPVGLLPDIRKIKLNEDTIRLGTAIRSKEARLADVAEAGGKSVKTEAELAKLQDKLADVERLKTAFKKPHLVPVPIAKYLRKQQQGWAARFGNRGAEVQAELDVERTEQAKDLMVLDERRAEVLSSFENIRQAEHLEESVLMHRLLVGSESRKFDPALRAAAEADIVYHLPPTIEEKARHIGLVEGAQLKKARADSLKKLDKLDKNFPIGSPKAEELKLKIMSDFNEQVAGIKLVATHKQYRLGEIAKQWHGTDKLSGDELNLIHVMFDDADELVVLSQKARVPITSLNQESLSYVKRVLSPEARALKKSNKAQFNLYFNEAKQRLGSQHKRSIFPERGIEEINEYFRRIHKLKYDFFDPNVLNAWYNRQVDHIRAINKARTANAFVVTYARTGIRGVSARKFLQDTGLEPGRIGGNQPIDKELKLPKDMVRQLTNVDQFFKDSIFNDSNLVGWLGKLDNTFNSYFRIGLTTPFPAFHARNFVGNMFLNALAGVTNPKWYWEAHRLQLLQRRIAKGEKVALSVADAKIIEEITIHGIPRSGQLGAIWADIGAKAGARKLLEPGTIPVASRYLNWMKNFGEGIENQSRIAHFLAKRSAGFTPIEAMRSVNKYLFDYSDLTEFEKKVMRPIFLFYTWMRKNTPLMVATSIKNPRLVNTWNKLTGISDEEVPSYLQAASVLALPGGRAVSDPGIPLTDLRFLNVGDADPTEMDGIRRAFSRVASMMSPAFKASYELTMGRSAFSQRSISDMPLQWLIDQTPLARGVRDVYKVLDPDTSGIARLARAVTGAKVYKYNPARAEEDAWEKLGIQKGVLRRFGVVGRRSEVDKEDPIYKRINEELKKARRKLHSGK